MIFAFLNLSVSCSYYKARRIQTNPDNFSSQYHSIHKRESYVIIHSGNETWHLNNLTLNEDRKEITASLIAVSQSHTLYPLKENSKSRGYNKSKASGKTLEIHFYTNEIINKNTSPEVVIPFSNINRIEVYQPDSAKKVLSIVGFTVASLAVIAIIVAATKSSCPFVYIKNDDSYTLQENYILVLFYQP